MKSENLKFMEPSGPLQACNGTAVALAFTLALPAVCAVTNMAVFCSSLIACFPGALLVYGIVLLLLLLLGWVEIMWN
jgi:hypothetical protein